MFATMIGAVIASIVLGKLISLACSFMNSVSFIYKAIQVISSIFKCFSFGMLERDVIVEVEQGNTKKLTDRHHAVRKKLKDLGLQMNFDAIDDFKLDRIADFLEDYDIEESSKKD
jgi:predicted Holliday junction resolvase-like endonuclease